MRCFIGDIKICAVAKTLTRSCQKFVSKRLQSRFLVTHRLHVWFGRDWDYHGPI